MKTCPKCNRTFPDEGQKFCTFDGGLLIAPQTFDPNATIRATSIDLNAASERPTSRDLPDPNATIAENYPATVALPRNTGPTGRPTTTNADTADFNRPAAPPPPPPVTPPPPVEQVVPPPAAATIVEHVAPPPPPPPVAPPPPPVVPPPPVEQVAPPPPPEPRPSAPISTAAVPVVPAVTTGPVVEPQAPSAPLPPPVTKKKSKAPWIIAGVLIFLLLSGGVLAAAFFLVVKPKLDQMAAERGANENRPVITTNTNTNTATPEPTVEQPSPSPSPTDSFVPPPNTVQFTNTKDGLQGALADHYFDFSFYYPNSWTRVQKASTQNFVQVERKLPPDLTQENFVVGSYPSTGTFVGDLPSYQKRVEEFSASLAKAFPEYHKVSEGPTKVNSMDGYEFRWEGLSKVPDHGDVHLWGRVIFVPTGKEGDTTGAILSMFTTSLAPELSSVEDVGTKGEAPVILESFRFGKK